MTQKMNKVIYFVDCTPPIRESGDAVVATAGGQPAERRAEKAMFPGHVKTGVTNITPHKLNSGE